MMVRMCFLTGVLAMIFILKSCIFSGCEKIALNQEDLSWYKSLPNEGDTLFFKGSDNTIDTFLISNKFNEFTDCNRFEFGKYQYEEFRYSGKLLNSKSSRLDNFDIHFTKNLQTDSDSGCNKMIQVFNLYFEGVTSLNLFKQDSILVKSLNKRLPTIFIDKSKYTDVRGANRIVTKNFNWSKEYGLVRYMTEDSVVYEYWKKR